MAGEFVADGTYDESGQRIQRVVELLRSCADPVEASHELVCHARSLLRAGEAYILIRENHSIRLHVSDGLPPDIQSSQLAWGESFDGWRGAQVRPVVISDAARLPSFRDAFQRPDSPATVAAYPLVARGEVTGFLVAAREAPAGFSAQELQWLEVLGGLATIVVENDRTRRAHERRAYQAEVLLDVISQSGGEPETMLQRLADTLTLDLSADRVDVLLLDKAAENLLCLGTAGWPVDSRCTPTPLPVLQGGPLTGVLQTGQPFIASGPVTDRALQDRFQGAVMRSVLAEPILIQGTRKGVLLLAAKESDAFGPEDQALALVVAARIGVLIEEDELRRRRHDLERAETETSARQEFIGVVSHELKTPVAVIQAYADVLLRRAERAGDEANLDVVRRIREQSERMLDMVDQVLDLQRLEAGLMVLESSRFDLASLAKRVVEGMATLTSQHELRAEASEPVLVVADRRRIEEVLNNLLQNAIKYSPNGGSIVVKTQLDPTNADMAVVSVSDQGIGIAPEDQPQVFERFYQGRNRLYQGHVGLGLGLYISQELVLRHGGEVWMESSPGKGSTFYFSLPVAGLDEADV